ncbi:MAG: acetylornithine transaminase [Corynebacterium sp.]|nr:acetylornithine transaminase [Corynebacterium sp.]
MSNMIEQWNHCIMNNYGTPSIALVSGNGVVVQDEHGREFIDMLAGIAVTSLGHAHPAVVAAIHQQAATLGHVSNLFATQPALDVAEKLIQRFACGDSDIAKTARVYFCNSGAEANEAAFKIARLTGRRRILAANNGFHGRTMGALALTGQPDKRDAFAPLPSGVEFYPFGDLDYLTKLVELNSQDVAAIILEPIQGETGVIPADPEFLRGIRALCDQHGILMIVDEVQTGVGRTGDFFAHHYAGITPDVVTMAKGLGAGLPIGACLAHGQAAEFLAPGKHGTTFGGNPISCAAAKVVLDIVDADFCDAVAEKGSYLRDQLAAKPFVDEVRGRGLMLGVVLQQPLAKHIVAQGLNTGVILNAPNEYVLRLTPPLIISREELDEAISRIVAAYESIEGNAQ